VCVCVSVCVYRYNERWDTEGDVMMELVELSSQTSQWVSKARGKKKLTTSSAAFLCASFYVPRRYCSRHCYPAKQSHSMFNSNKQFIVIPLREIPNLGLACNMALPPATMEKAWQTAESFESYIERVCVSARERAPWLSRKILQVEAASLRPRRTTWLAPHAPAPASPRCRTRVVILYPLV
jgi:hypothetical protein